MAAAVVLLASSLDLSTSRAAVEPGFGKAQAQILTLDPRSAQLSFGVRFGPTVADHRNLVARAQAQSTDYGLVGSALTGDGCDGGEPFVRSEDLPQPLRADSRNPEDLGEKTVSEGPITQSVQADPSPHARATSRLGEASIPGVLGVAGASSSTVSGVDGDGVAEVRATVDVAAIDLLAGVIHIGGLHWEATQRGGEDPTGKFTIGEASIGGAPLPTQDASAVVDAVNNVVKTLGIVLVPPVTHVEADTIFVDPLRVGLAPNQTRDLIAGTALAAIQPVREALFQVLLDSSCNAGGAITVIDLLLGSVTGGGSFTAVLGGAQAQLADAGERVSVGSGTTGTGGPIVGGTGGATFPRPSTPPRTASTVAPPGRLVADPPTRTTSSTAGEADDHAVPVALAALLLGGLLIEADRRKMRQAGVATTLAPPVPTEAPQG